MVVLEVVAGLWRDVGKRLAVPAAVMNVIASESTSDLESLRKSLRYWVQRDPNASWRRLIWRFHWSQDPNLWRVADDMTGLAEKLTDTSLTLPNVLAALRTVEDVEILGADVLHVPYTKREKVRRQSASVEEWREDLVKYFLHTNPNASWEWLLGQLLRYGEEAAVQDVKVHIETSEDPTLTLTSLTQLLVSVRKWDQLRQYLHIPRVVYLDIMGQYHDEAQRVQSWCEWYLTHHPAPSWLHVANGLYFCKEHNILDDLKSQVQYLKGSIEYRRHFSEAMKDGHVDSLIGKAILYGAAGTGKSSFMELVTDNPPPDIRRSTPLASRPVSVFQMDVTDERFKKLTLQQRKEMVAKAMANVEIGQEDTSSGSDSISSDEEEAGNKPVSVSTETLTTKRMSSSDDPNHKLQPPTSSPRASQHSASQRDKHAILRSVAECSSLVQLVEQYSRTGETITRYFKILFIDSGGQPQFHEMLPAFLRRMTLYVFVFKLSDELATKPVVEYYNSSGEAVGTPYRSAQTNEQLFQHCLRTLRTHRTTSKSECKASRIMIVGTHRDKEGECTAETRAKKNEKLASLLLPEFKDEVTYSADEEFIFAVNAKDPQLEDRALAKRVQRLVLADCAPYPVKVPLRYYCLEIILEEATQTLGRGVLSIDECLAAAAELHFDEHTLEAALEFLDKISVLFYFPEVLEGVVFTNPQVLLDKATEPVEKVHSLRNDPSSSDAIVTAEEQEFKDHALFTLEFLGQEAFQKHYVPNLFTPVELVKLFGRLLLIANFSNTKYLMPALLEVLQEDEVCKHRVPVESPAAALALDFPLGGPRLGTFCALICFLVSPNNQFPCPWDVVLRPKSNTPACLYRNCIQFSLSGFPGLVTLIDTFTHFEVHVSTSSKVTSEVCAIVRRAIFAGLKKAHHTLGYSNCIPSPAILCPCGGDSVHIATLGKGLWVCKEDKMRYGDVTARHLVWEESNLEGTAAPEYSLDHDYVKAAECESPEVHFTVISEPPLAEDAKHMLTDENGKAATKRFKIHVNCVTFHNVKPSDSGVYTISCRNEAGVIGEETLELDITAAGHPTPSAWKSERMPTLSSLTQLDVVKKVSTEWRQLGVRLGQSMSDLDNYEKKEMLDNIKCCLRVFDSWINSGGTSLYPLSWKSVYNILCAIDHRGTAEDMKSALAKEGIHVE